MIVNNNCGWSGGAAPPPLESPTAEHLCVEEGAIGPHMAHRHYGVGPTARRTCIPPSASMANDEHVAWLKKGVAAWNAWRDDNSATRPDLSEANLTKADLTGADLSKAELSMANLSGANLSGADLFAANPLRRDPFRSEPSRG